jgi:hypothetical protein
LLRKVKLKVARYLSRKVDIQSPNVPKQSNIDSGGWPFHFAATSGSLGVQTLQAMSKHGVFKLTVLLET